MNCNIILDLMPLKIDGCCSEESAEMIEAHIADCPGCKSVYETMNKGVLISSEERMDVKVKKIQMFKASVLQSVSVYLAFLLIIVGVWLESTTPTGLENGKWAFLLILPATAFFLSLSNFHFVRIHKSQKSASVFSFVLCILFSGFGCFWALFHYGAEVFSGNAAFAVGGVVLELVLSALSGILAYIYARLAGKE